MKINLSLEQIKNILNSSQTNPAKLDPQILIDTLSLNSNNQAQNWLFLAIKGEKFDGHDFLLQALKNGAIAFVVSAQVWTTKSEDYKKQVLESINNIFFVDDTVLALHKIAEYFLQSKNIKKIVITGSVGKTTTKDVLFFVLKHFYKTQATKGNFNNHIGVPLTIFEIEDDTEICVFEIGINHKNEMNQLSKIVKPDIGIILNIGKSHLEYLKDLDGVLDAKWELIENIKQNGVLFLNGDDDKLLEKFKAEKEVLKHKIDIKNYGKNFNNNFSGKIISVNNENQTLEFSENLDLDGKKYQFEFSVLGMAGFYSALVAFSVCRTLGIEAEQIIERLKQFNDRTKMRFERSEVNGIQIINDCYNANPTSMTEALLVFSKLDAQKTGKKIIVLGDMLELGESSDIEHKNLANVLKDLSVDMIFLYGEKSFLTYQELVSLNLKNKIFFHSFSKDEIAENLKKNIKQNDMLFFKASRGMKLEEIIAKIV
jgi:UDP-N-acetylmuramoyl-tripeptide--D-alanyl-D-alanine ligase